MASLYAALMTYETGHHLARARTVGITSIRGALQFCEEALRQAREWHHVERSRRSVGRVPDEGAWVSAGRRRRRKEVIRNEKH
jgi:hypothetical protein